MDSDLRASLAVGVVASAISALVGILSSIPFLPLFLRALIGGILAVALTFGAMQLLRRAVPDLFSASGPVPAEAIPNVEAEGAAEAAPEDADPSMLGQAVDIVLPGGTEDGSFLAPMDAGAAEPFDAATARAEEVHLLEPDEAVSAAPFSAEAPLPRSSGGIDDLDVLPDLESLSDSFSEPISPATVASGGEGGGYSDVSRSAAPAQGGDADPATLAQAVRTLLKRDQKG